MLEMDLDASKVAVFKAGTALKGVVNGVKK